MTDVTPDPKPAKKTPEQKKADRAAYEKARRAAAKAAKAPVQIVADDDDVERVVEVVSTPIGEIEIVEAIAPVVELPTSDAPVVAATTLAAEFIAALAERVGDVVEKPSPTGRYIMVKVEKKTLAYVNFTKNGIRVDVRLADGEMGKFKATSSDDFGQALDAAADRVAPPVAVA